MARKNRKRSALGKRGQSTVEYLLMVAFGAIIAIQIAKFFNGVFDEGLRTLEQTTAQEIASGQGYF